MFEATLLMAGFGRMQAEPAAADPDPSLLEALLRETQHAVAADRDQRRERLAAVRRVGRALKVR